MPRYSWSTGNRSGASSRKPNYSVKWEWRDPDAQEDYHMKVDLVEATNAERAIAKVRKRITDEYSIGRKSDIVIIHAVPIDGVYYDL